MAKDTITGLVVSEGQCEWAVAALHRRRVSISARGRALASEAGAPDSDEAASSAPGDLIAAHAGEIRGAIVLGLPTEMLLLKVLELPPVDDEEIASMVELQADKLSPFPIEMMVVSHEVLAKAEEGCRVLLAAAPIRQVEQIGTALEGIHARALRVDAVAMGWWRLLQDHGAAGGEPLQIFFIQETHRLEMIVARRGVPHMVRGFLLRDDESCAAEIASEVALTMLSLELEGGAGVSVLPVAYMHEDGRQDIVEAIATACDRDIDCRDIAGLGDAAEGVLRRHAAGAALDLTPRSWIDAQARGRFRRRMVLSAAAVLSVWCLCAGVVLGSLYRENSRLEELRAERAVLVEPALQVRELRRRVFVVEQYMDRSDSALECLREISLLMPQGVELDSFAYRKKGREVTIDGSAQTVGQVYEFKTQLDASGLFCESELGGPRRTGSTEIFDVRLVMCEVVP